jgi:hypothetical protein
MALYSGAAQMLLPESATQPRIRPVLVVLHTNGGNNTLESSYRYWQGADTEAHFQLECGPPNGRGRLGQYIDTGTRADSQSAANSFYRAGVLCGAISIETSDLGSPWEKSWTDLGQRQTLEDWLVWACATHGIPPVLAYADPAGGWTGIGYHHQVPSWSNAAHICPGPGKIREVPNLIAAVAARLKEEPMTPEDRAYLDAKFAAVAPYLSDPSLPDWPTFGTGQAIGDTRAFAQMNNQALARIEALLAGVDLDAIRQAVIVTIAAIAAATVTKFAETVNLHPVVLA